MRYLIAIILTLGLGTVAWKFMSSKHQKMEGMMHNKADNNNSPKTIPLILNELSLYQKDGKTIFDANCAACHGDNASGGTGAGPSLIHRIYEPNHHGDFAFYRAVKNGVRAHHWPYGNMPKQPQVNEEQVAKIVDYIRKLQKDNGIF